MGTQWASGNQNVQISDVSSSSIHITYEARRRKVPLEPAVVPVAQSVRSPARLVRARSGFVPFAVRGELLAGLEEWAVTDEPFAGCVIGGRGGVGKTRLGVELCEAARKAGWLSGMLARGAEQAALEELVEAPTPTLVVVDYAETRAAQLEVLLPALAARATTEHAVRVVLLVRASPHGGRDWTDALRRRGDMLDAVLDGMEVRVLDEEPLTHAERECLFAAAAAVFAARSHLGPPTIPPNRLRAPMFSSPLLVVVAAYLAVHGQHDLPATRAELLEGLLAHEDQLLVRHAVRHHQR